MSTVSETDRKDVLTDDELERLHADDLQASRIVAGLMMSVFLVGLLMYSYICWLSM